MVVEVSLQKWLWKWQSYCSRGKVHCKDVDVVALVIIVRVGVICKDVLGRGWQTDSALLVLTKRPTWKMWKTDKC